MDDLSFSSNDNSNILSIQKDISNVLKKGCFEIKNWHSNVPGCDTSNILDEVKYLGIRWSKTTDCLSVDLKHHNDIKNGSFTRRICLSITAAVFDPIGVVAALMLPIRIDLRKLNIFGYDELLDQEQQNVWLQHQKTIKQLGKMVLKSWADNSACRPLQHVSVQKTSNTQN